MATFVLVHGAWHGGWCYARVAKKLRAAGHDVYTPTLTGVGERSHLNGMAITLSTHIKDIVNVIEYENLKDVILCGHSYGGMVISGVASEIGERLRCLFFLDAFLPKDGESLFDLVGSEQAINFLGLVKASNGRLPPIPAAAFSVNTADAAWVDRTCVPQSLLTFTDGVKITAKYAAVPHRTYLLANGYEMHVFDKFYEQVKGDPRWKAATVKCGHDVMLDDPDALTKLLLEEATR